MLLLLTAVFSVAIAGEMFAPIEEMGEIDAHDNWFDTFKGRYRVRHGIVCVKCKMAKKTPGELT